MEEETDIKKRLGDKYRHITWVNTIRAGLMNPADRPQYYTDVANQKDEEEKRQKRKSQEAS